MSKRLQVRNLPVTCDNAQLQTMFASFGTVKSARVVVDQYNGKSRGFGYVEMSSIAEASSIVEKMNGQEHEGRVLAITEAKAAPGRRTKKS